MSYVVDFRGHPACPCLAEWLPVYEAELLRRGVIKVSLDIYQLIGGAPASGGTHTDGGAFDIAQTSDEAIWTARQMGADATWHRAYNWDNAGGMSHTHGVLRGCPHNGPARYQLAAVDAGFNGLGYLGHSAPDDGPRPLSGRTWREGIAWAQEQGDPMADYAAQLDAIQKSAEQAVQILLEERKKSRDRVTRVLGRLATIRDQAKDDATKKDLQAAVDELTADQ